MLPYFHSLNPTLPSSHDTFLHCHMLEFTFQIYPSQSCNAENAQLPISVCLYQPLSKHGSYRKATLAKHYFCWVPVQCLPMSQVLNLLFQTLHLHSKTTLCVHCSAHEFVSSTIKHLHWKMHTNINTVYIQLQSNPTRKQISATGCHDNTHFLFQYLYNYHYYQPIYSPSQCPTLHSWHHL